MTPTKYDLRAGSRSLSELPVINSETNLRVDAAVRHAEGGILLRRFFVFGSWKCRAEYGTIAWNPDNGVLSGLHRVHVILNRGL